MSDRQREREAGGGGLTGATGDLVPPDPSDELLTGERREVESASQRADVTASMRARSGSTKGLPADDPAYQMEQSPSASESTDEAAERRSPPATGADERGEAPDRF